MSLDSEGPIFDGEDEQGDFAPLPLLKRRRRPSHPGAILRDLYLPPTGLTQSELAERLGVSRRTINMVLNESRPVTVDMAHRLARAFNTSPDFWLKLQRDRDLWDALHEHASEYDRIAPVVRRAA